VSSDRTVLALLGGANFAQLGARLLISPVVPAVIVAFDTSKAAVGLVLTGMWAVYALLQFPSGVLGDRYGERRLLLGALGLTAGGSLAVALAPTFAAFGAAVLFLGAGSGLFFSPAASLLSRLFAERGRALGALTGGGAVAGAAYPLAAGFVAPRWGWRPAVAVGAAVALPVFVAVLVVVRRRDPVTPDRRFGVLVDAALVRDLLTRPGVAYTLLLAVLFAFAFQAFASFFPTFLVEYHSLSTERAAAAFGAAFVLSAAAQSAVGRLSDAVSRNAAVAVSAVLAGSGLSVLLLWRSLPGVVVGTLLLGLGVSWPGAIQARFMDELGAAERGLGFGLVRTVYMFLAAAGSVVTGALADAAGWATAYGFLVGLLAVGLVVLAAGRLAGLDG
jgi:predicted MFS family arabinose efflux permease